MEYSERIKEIDNRLDYLKKYYPFFRIYATSNLQKTEYDAPFLALDVLTFLIEQGRLLGRPVPIDEIEEHIQQTLVNVYPSITFDVRDVTRSLLGMLETDTQGMLYQYQYFDPLHQRMVEEFIQLIEYDVKESAYRITDTGLDFMISTKELPEESKISVTLILFEKQIKSGSFRNALATIRELNLAVQLKKRRKEALLEKLITGGKNVVEDFEQYSQEVLSQLKHENELFTQVHLLLTELSENREKIANNTHLTVTEEDFIIIKDIAVEVEHGYKIHNALLNEFTDFPEDYERINRIRLNSLFEKRYQFQEALENHIRANVSNEIHIITIHPLLFARVPKRFNLLKIFEHQIIASKKNDLLDTRSMEDWTDEKPIDTIVGERQSQNFLTYAKILLNALSEKKQLTLGTYIDAIIQQTGKDGIRNVDLIPFLLELNSNSEFHLTKEIRKEEKPKNPYESAFDLTDNLNQGYRHDQIEESLHRAYGNRFTNGSILKIFSKPESLVNIGENGNVQITDMIFILE
jgi:hypothetical protein